MEAPTMNGGCGDHSYVKNSSIQRKIMDSVKSLVAEVIAEDLELPSSLTTFRIADLGCSVGPNTFFAVQDILEAVEKRVPESQTMDFQVFFNDQASNDFNTLFTLLPTARTYYAAGVPGSFHGRLFPDSSLHFVYTSSALQWLSRVPEEVLDRNNIAWNKGKVHYSHAGGKQVALAYANQHARDMDRFLEARAKEVAVGGLMAMVFPIRPTGFQHHECVINIFFDTLGSCLSHMVKEGLIDEEKVDTFNIPIYISSLQEVEDSINRNGCFSIERMTTTPSLLPGDRKLGAELMSKHARAALEGQIKEHFGPEILDRLFEMYTSELDHGYSDIFMPSTEGIINIFILLKGKAVDKN